MNSLKNPTRECQNVKSLFQALKVKICDLVKSYLEQMGVGNTIQKLRMSSLIIFLFQADIFIMNEALAC